MMNKKMNLDLLTELLVLEECHRVPDGQGGMTVEWRTVETLWACIQPHTPTSSTEQWQGSRPHYAARYGVWLRRSHVLPLSYRLRWGTQILVPISAVSRWPGQEWQMVLTEEDPQK